MDERTLTETDPGPVNPARRRVLAGMLTAYTASLIPWAVVAPWLTFRPNLQYIIRPGGTGAIRNALVFGPYTQVTF